MSKLFEYALHMVVLVVIILGGGCAAPIPPSRPVSYRPPEPVDNRQPTEWRIDNQNLDKNPKTNFRVTVKHAVRNKHSITIKGTVDSCYYEYIPIRNRKVPRQYFSAGRWVQDWKEESETLPERQKDWIPDVVQIATALSGTKRVEVVDGRFELSLDVPKNYFVQPPIPQKYLAPIKLDRRYDIAVTAVNPPHGGSFTTSAAMPALWRYALDKAKARRYVNSRTCDVVLRFRDSTSRKSIMPKVAITALRPNKDEIMALLSKEFGGNKELLESVSGDLYEILFEDSKKTSITGNMRLRTWEGGLIKIEATHGKYYHFSTELETDSAREFKKDILLVEKGSKIRMEQTNEGEVGSMVDSE